MNEQGEHIVVYRPLSKMSVVATILALIGLTSLLVPQLLFAPFFAVVCAVVALWRIRSSDGETTGAGLAMFALFVSLFCVSNVISHYMFHSRRLVRESRGHAEAFFDLLAHEQLYQAHQLMLPEHERHRQGADLATYYKTAQADPFANRKAPSELMETAFEDPAMKELVEYLQSGKRPKYVRPLGCEYETDFQTVRLEYQLERADDLFMVVFRRRIDPETGETSWQFWASGKKGAV